MPLDAETFVDSATAVVVHPDLIRSQSRSRHCGVRGALACTRAFVGEGAAVEQLHTYLGGSLTGGR